MLARWQGEELHRQAEEKARTRKAKADKAAAELRKKVTGKG